MIIMNAGSTNHEAINLRLERLKLAFSSASPFTADDGEAAFRITFPEGTRRIRNIGLVTYVTECLRYAVMERLGEDCISDGFDLPWFARYVDRKDAGSDILLHNEAAAVYLLATDAEIAATLERGHAAVEKMHFTRFNNTRTVG